MLKEIYFNNEIQFNFYTPEYETICWEKKTWNVWEWNVMSASQCITDKQMQFSLS